jgi:hypothetical protein
MKAISPEIAMKAGILTLASLLASAPASGAADWKPAPGDLMTRWAAKVDPARPHPEYPRPQLVREAWRNLNGLWQFEIAAKDAPQPPQFSRHILVPFPVESALSGIKQRVSQKDRLWYQRGFTVPAKAPVLKDNLPPSSITVYTTYRLKPAEAGVTSD